MNKKETVTRALDRLADHTGLYGQWTPAHKDVDGTIDLTIQDKKTHFYIEVKTELREYQLPKLLEMKKRYDYFIVVADRIFPTLKEKLRAYKIGYLDAAGNVYIHTADHFIWLDGQKPVQAEKPITNRAFTKTGLKTVFYLLLHQNAINMPYRALAAATNVALGNIKNVILGLKDAGFILQINDKDMQLQNKKALLHRWIAGYRETLKPSLNIGNYHFYNHEQFIEWKNLPVKPGETVWGAEPAAELVTNYLSPEILTIYTVENRAALLPKWKLIPDNSGNVRFYEKFWHDQQTNDLPYVPYLLIYADLILTDDPRCMETAELIYTKYLKHEFE